MGKLRSCFAIVVVAVLGPTSKCGLAAPALGERPVKWEYAELRYGHTRVPLPAGAPGGGLGGGGEYKFSIRWCTESDEIEGTKWEDLAGKLKAPALKKEGSATIQKLRVLNRIGADGWELVDHSGDEEPIGLPAPGSLPTAKWIFKRRLP